MPPDSLAIWTELTQENKITCFRKHRDDKGAYFDGLMCGAMAVYLSFYYMALNYPEGIPETEEDVGKRNLLACVVIVRLLNLPFSMIL